MRLYQKIIQIGAINSPIGAIPQGLQWGYLSASLKES